MNVIISKFKLWFMRLLRIKPRLALHRKGSYEDRQTSTFFFKVPHHFTGEFCRNQVREISKILQQEIIPNEVFDSTQIFVNREIST